MLWSELQKVCEKVQLDQVKGGALPEKKRNVNDFLQCFQTPTHSCTMFSSEWLIFWSPLHRYISRLGSTQKSKLLERKSPGCEEDFRMPQFVEITLNRKYEWIQSYAMHLLPKIGVEFIPYVYQHPNQKRNMIKYSRLFGLKWSDTCKQEDISNK